MRIPTRTRLHTLTLFFVYLTVVVFGRPVVGFVDSCSEALVAASSPDHIWARAVERDELTLSVHLGHGRLETLQRAGLLQAEGRAEFHGTRWGWGGRGERHRLIVSL